MRNAKRVPMDLAGSGWYELLPPPPPARELTQPLTADWVVVGAGFAGLAAARRLTQLRPGHTIVVLEAQRIGWGAAGRNSGFMIDLPHDLNTVDYSGAAADDHKQIRMNRAGIRFAREAAEEYGLLEHFKTCGKYHAATGGHGLAALRQFGRHLDALGESYTSLNAAELKEVTGSSYYAGGTHAPGAAIIQPAAYIRGVGAGLARHVELFENSPVLRIEPGRDHVVWTAKGKVTTPRVILTVNGHVESFGYFPRQLMHVFTFGSMTRQLSAAELKALGGAGEWALIPADPMGSTVRKIRQGRIVVRNTFTYNPGMATSAAQVARMRRRHRRSFDARFPMLADVDFQYSWGGHLCLSLNAVPAFGEVEDGIYAACCCNGLGTVKGTLGGRLIADLATKTPEPMVQDMLAQPAPRKLYPEPLMTIGANARLWWMHHRAGREL
jgi:glycine/D-amino acid oxidase-like deaminating enzyme